VQHNVTITWPTVTLAQCQRHLVTDPPNEVLRNLRPACFNHSPTYHCLTLTDWRPANCFITQTIKQHNASKVQGNVRKTGIPALTSVWLTRGRMKGIFPANCNACILHMFLSRSQLKSQWKLVSFFSLLLFPTGSDRILTCCPVSILICPRLKI